MLDPITSKRRLWRRTLLLASVISASPLVTPVSAAQPPVSAAPQLGSTSGAMPKRLPQVITTGSGIPVRAIPNKKLTPNVRACSAEFDALVESWFAEPEKEEKASPEARWLRSTTSSASAEAARRLIAQASRDFEVGAWLSAETSAWEAIKWAAEAVDLAARERGELLSPSSLENLQAARDAIREARDFSGVYGPLDGEAIARMAISHQTNVLDEESTIGVTATDASDRYLDHARVLLAPIAKQSMEAAQALDLLAAVYLKRADAKMLPSATALSLRRAALQGQPRNASLASRLGMHLADLGLLDEARWALEHSLSIENDPKTASTLVQVLRRSGQNDQAAQLLARVQLQVHGDSRLAANQSDSAQSVPSSGAEIRVPEIVELSPQEFASISQPVVPFEKSDRSIAATPVSATIAAKETPSAKAESVKPTPSGDDRQEDKPGVIRRFFGSLKKIW